MQAIEHALRAGAIVHLVGGTETEVRALVEETADDREIQTVSCENTTTAEEFPEARLPEDTVVHYAVFGNHRPRAILVDRDTAPLLTSAPLREMADLEGFAQAAPSVTRVPVLTPQEATQRWPRLMPWSHRNPKAGAALGVAIVLVFAVLAAILAAWLVP